MINVLNIYLRVLCHFLHSNQCWEEEVCGIANYHKDRGDLCVFYLWWLPASDLDWPSAVRTPRMLE